MPPKDNNNKPQELSIRQMKALVKFARESGLKKFEYCGLRLEFEEEVPEDSGLSLEEDSENKSDQQVAEVEVQELLKSDIKDKAPVIIDKDDLW